MKRLPLTASAMTAAMAVASLPWTSHAALRFERSSILGDLELWRVVTGAFVHGTPRLFALDVPVTAGLIWLLEERRGAVTAIGVALWSALASGLSTLAWAPQIQTLEGASGIASGVLAFLLADLVAEGSRRQRRLAAIVAMTFAAKLLAEVGASGSSPWWVDPGGSAEVVGAAHAGGALAGIVAWARAR